MEVSRTNYLQRCRTLKQLLPRPVRRAKRRQVLAIGSRLIILGEVGEDPEGAEGDLVVRKAAPSSILDLKTSSISRPFVVSTKTEQGLLQVTLFPACKHPHYIRNIDMMCVYRCY